MISPSGDLSLQRLQMTREINESVREECTMHSQGCFMKMCIAGRHHRSR